MSDFELLLREQTIREWKDLDQIHPHDAERKKKEERRKKKEKEKKKNYASSKKLLTSIKEKGPLGKKSPFTRKERGGQ